MTQDPNSATSATIEDQDQDEVGHGCRRPGCGRSVVEHLGFTLGHLYRAPSPGCPTCGGPPSIHTTTTGQCALTEVQHPQGAEATARTFSSDAPTVRMYGYAGISLAGRWECGSCGASGDGWWDEDKGLTLDVGEHVCPDDD